MAGCTRSSRWCDEIAAVVFFGIAALNDKECHDTKTCPAGMVLRLQNHECECTARATDNTAE